MPSTVRTARTPTDLKPNLIRVQKREYERADRCESGQRVKEFQHMVTSDQIVGRPRTEFAIGTVKILSQIDLAVSGPVLF
jgi:hypothetical protein